MLIENECGDITAADLRVVYGDPATAPPVAHIRDPLVRCARTTIPA